MILGVDLAARFSAGIVLGRDREVHLQFDSWGRDHCGTALLIAECARAMQPDLIVIEDVPYGLSKQFMVKPVLRLQGQVIQELMRSALLDRTVFVAPATWQRAQGVWKVKPADTADAARVKGYEPPDLRAVHAHEIPAKGPERTKILSSLRKSTTDYVDAFLIADWAADHTLDDLLNMQGVQPITETTTSWLPRQKTPSPHS